MAFALQVRDSLHVREAEVRREFANGDTLEAILTRDLVAVETAADTDMVTSILLLEGTHLRHAAGPRLPEAYRSAIDGVEIGPAVGSCGTAAYNRRATYVTDIASDPLWVDYRDVALPHGLRACWSTPLFDDAGGVVGTFAIYHRTPRSPTPEEVEAISAITGHVTRAILSSKRAPTAPVLRIVGGDEAGISDEHQLLLQVADKLEQVCRAVDLALDALPVGELSRAELVPLAEARTHSLEVVARVRAAIQGSR